MHKCKCSQLFLGISCFSWISIVVWKRTVSVSLNCLCWLQWFGSSWYFRYLWSVHQNHLQQPQRWDIGEMTSLHLYSHQSKTSLKHHESGYFSISKSSEIIWWSLYMRNRPQFKSLLNIKRCFLHWSSCFCMFKSKTFTVHSITGSCVQSFLFLLILGLQDLGEKNEFEFFLIKSCFKKFQVCCSLFVGLVKNIVIIY